MPNLNSLCIDVMPSTVLLEIHEAQNKVLVESVNFQHLLEKRRRIKDAFDDSSKIRKHLVYEELLQELALQNRYKWKNGSVLRVKFLDEIITFNDQILNFASEWSKYCNIKFIQSNDDNSEIRISSCKNGSWSCIGNGTPKTGATMNFGWFNRSTPQTTMQRTVLHEFGHALGCIHEHQSPQSGIQWNTELVYRTYGSPPNNWNREKVDINLLNRYTTSEISNSFFDPESIMLYPIESWQTLDGYHVDWNNVLSENDKIYIEKMYPF